MNVSRFSVLLASTLVVAGTLGCAGKPSNPSAGTSASPPPVVPSEPVAAAPVEPTQSVLTPAPSTFSEPMTEERVARADRN